MLRVLLVDDEETVRATLPSLLERHNDLEVAAVAADGSSALQLLRTDIDVDIVLLDVDMPTMDGIDTARIITDEFPDVAIVMLTAFRQDSFLDRALSAGASGFLVKTMPPSEIARLLIDAAHGATVMAPRATELLARSARDRQIRREADPAFVAAAASLSPALRDIFDLITIATSTDLMASTLHLTRNTVRVYVSDVLRRTGCRSREELVLRAAETGLTMRSPSTRE